MNIFALTVKPEEFSFQKPFFKSEVASSYHVTITLFWPSENQHIEIRTAVGAEPIAVKDVPDLLSCNEWRSFWITQGSRQLIIGRGEEYGEEELIGFLNRDTLSDITSIKFDTFNNSTGKWDFKLIKLSEGKAQSPQV